MRRFLAVSGAFLSLHFLDVILTYRNTPDLANEANPLVTKLGWGWHGLLLSGLFLSALYVLVAFFLFVKYKRRPLVAKNRREYFSMMCFDRPDKFLWTLYKLPKHKENWKAVLYILGSAGLYSLIASKVILVAEWLSITFSFHDEWYWSFRDWLPFGRMDIWAGLLVFLVASFIILERSFYRDKATGVEHHTVLNG